jgi:ribonuclease Z
VRFGGYTVTAFAVSHGITALGYIFEEDARPGRFDREKAIALGIAPGPLFGRLQRGETIPVGEEGRHMVVRPSDVMGPPRPGRKIVYTGDSRPIPGRIAAVARDADLLIHDATYDDSEKDRAVEFYHATAGQAGDAAAAAGALTLALIHISSRYTDADSHINDARKKFSGHVIAPHDLDMVEVPFRH